jgi:hypothetical protein
MTTTDSNLIYTASAAQTDATRKSTLPVYHEQPNKAVCGMAGDQSTHAALITKFEDIERTISQMEASAEPFDEAEIQLQRLKLDSLMAQVLLPTMLSIKSDINKLRWIAGDVATHVLPESENGSTPKTAEQIAQEEADRQAKESASKARSNARRTAEAVANAS